MEKAADLLRESEEVRATVVFEDIDLNNDAHSSVVYILRHMYKSIILEDLDYALDKKVEQELWNLCFKIPVSRLQASSTPSPAVKKKPDVNNPLLSWFLESAAGFYLVLLQEICTQCNLDTNICKSNTKLGIFNGPTYPRQPKNESCLYIIQHCLIHLGDLARYRKLLNEAEGYYKQAIQVESSSGHPYNQLALLESARGDQLSAVFYYVRSLALRHPFPPARANLEKMLKRRLASGALTYKSRSRLTVEEFLLSFLRFHAQIGFVGSSEQQVDQAEQILKLLSLSLPSLLSTESLTVPQLIKILAITIYVAEDIKQERSARLAVELVASMLKACLSFSCSVSSEQLPSLRYMAIIKLIIDWFHLRPDSLNRLRRSGQLWSATSRLLNELQLGIAYEEAEETEEKLLPEDTELLDFTPLFRQKKNGSTAAGKEEENRIRAVKIIERGKSLANVKGAYLVMTERSNDEGSQGPKFAFSVPLLETLTDETPSPIEEEPEPIKEFKILTRPPSQRNVALTAMLNKQQNVEGPLPSPLIPSTPTQPVKSNQVNNYPRPLLPLPLELIRPDQKERGPVHRFGFDHFGSSRTSLPDTSSLPPPPAVPPPGLGFPLPPPAWSLGVGGSVPPPPVPYSLFNSQTWGQSQGQGPGPLVLPSSIPPQNFYPGGLNTPEARTGLFGTNVGNINPTSSLWSGPGPSPLERLLEQQKATRGFTPGKQNNKPF